MDEIIRRCTTAANQLLAYRSIEATAVKKPGLKGG
jgi:hypothetical protein